MTAGAVPLRDHIAHLADDLAAREVVDEHRCGSLTARFTGPRYPVRAQAPRRWVHSHGVAFDLVALATAGRAGGVGTVHVDGLRIPARRTPLTWSARGGPPVLAGVTPGPSAPELWLHRPGHDERPRPTGIAVNHSLLDGAAPLQWTADGALVVLADHPAAPTDPDRVHDSSEGRSVLDDPDALVAAAAATVRVLAPRDGQRVLSGPHAVCRLDLSPDRTRVLIGAVRDAAAFERLVRDRLAEFSIHDLTGAAPARHLGECRVDRDFWGGADTARPARRRSVRPPEHRQISPDIALHGDGGPVVLWISPRPDIPDRTAFAPYAGAGAAEPPGPLWTYRPRCAVAMVRLWHPRQNGPATFAEIAARVVDGVRDAAERVRRELGEVPLVLGGHSFGAALAAVALPELGSVLRCAVLRSGAYNRTLTPAGFQLEHRPIWAAPDMYHGFTAVHSAHRITVPTLLTQGTSDPNSATTVWQARLFYEALRIAGAPARLVLLDAEGHHFGTADGILRAATEENEWIDRWCRERST